MKMELLKPVRHLMLSATSHPTIQHTLGRLLDPRNGVLPAGPELRCAETQVGRSLPLEMYSCFLVCNVVHWWVRVVSEPLQLMVRRAP